MQPCYLIKPQNKNSVAGTLLLHVDRCFREKLHFRFHLHPFPSSTVTFTISLCADVTISNSVLTTSYFYNDNNINSYIISKKVLMTKKSWHRNCDIILSVYFISIVSVLMLLIWWVANIIYATIRIKEIDRLTWLCKT